MARTAAPTAPAGTIHRTIALLHDALRALHAEMPLAEVERVAVMINEGMSAGARSFHTPEHVFDLVQAGRPRGTLAALFHDLVYYQVDQGFVPSVARVVENGIEAKDGKLSLPAGAATDRTMALTMAVFGLQPGQVLPPFGGMNEFLSALVMNRTLAAVVKEEDLLRATACIEATIPFRAPAADGTTPSQALAARLSAAVKRLRLSLDAAAITEAVQQAATFANGDVANFADREVTRFLDNTWKLLPETNPSLRFQGVYSVKSYRTALQKMEGFLRALDPGTIFARYEGVPSDKEYALKRRRAERNVITARSYLGIKLLTAAILEALADISGGDAPVSLFMGDIGATIRGSRLEDYLPAPPKAAGAVDMTLHDLLAYGRASASSFDLQNSPLSLFIYLHLGSDGFRDFLASARRM
ncbi:MAG TPA: hypothetical protein VL359_13685, partial [bacterium]|nr:hypothetical protein [bacterium]